MEERKILLSEDEMPRQWYNILADIKMNPPLGPDGNPISPEMLAPVFPDEPDRAGSQHRALDRHSGRSPRIFNIWRPAPLVRATALEKALGTPATNLLQK